MVTGIWFFIACWNYKFRCFVSEMLCVKFKLSCKYNSKVYGRFYVSYFHNTNC